MLYWERIALFSYSKQLDRDEKKANVYVRFEYFLFKVRTDRAAFAKCTFFMQLKKSLEFFPFEFCVALATFDKVCDC